MAAFTLPREIRFRPCLINEKHKGLFHKWVHISEIRSPSLLKGGPPGGVVCGDLALVECEDGTVCQVHPDKIRFLDSEGLFREYDWSGV